MKFQIICFFRKHGDESPELYSITLKEEFPDEEILNLVLTLKLTGAACVFYGNKEDRYLGLVLWAFALKLKEVYTIPEIPQIKLTPSQKLVMKDKKKISIPSRSSKADETTQKALGKSGNLCVTTYSPTLQYIS
jgi:hypothetical protein